MWSWLWQEWAEWSVQWGRNKIILFKKLLIRTKYLYPSEVSSIKLSFSWTRSSTISDPICVRVMPAAMRTIPTVATEPQITVRHFMVTRTVCSWVLSRNNGWGQLIRYLGKARQGTTTEVSIYWPQGQNITEYLLHVRMYIIHTLTLKVQIGKLLEFEKINHSWSIYKM